MRRGLVAAVAVAFVLLGIAGAAGAGLPDGPNEPWADFVVGYTPGSVSNGSSMQADRDDPAAALGPAESAPGDDNPIPHGSFVSLGFGGELILGFENPICNVEGSADLDIDVRETTKEPYPDEKAAVYVSESPTGPWAYAGTVAKDGSLAMPLAVAHYVRLVDVSDPAAFANRAVAADGFDVDGVRAANTHCVSLCPSGAEWGGTLSHKVLPSGDVKVRFTQYTSFNDNSYGANAVGWGAKGHSFDDLRRSDAAEFRVLDTKGKNVLDFALDYLTCDKTTAAAPSGCASRGALGGDGGVRKGQQSWILDWNTSLARNLNDTGYCSGGGCVVNGVDLRVNSPPTAGPTSYALTDPAFGQWVFETVYEVTISKDAFAANGFGGVTVREAHNSPAKRATCAAGEARHSKL